MERGWKRGGRREPGGGGDTLPIAAVDLSGIWRGQEGG